MSPRDRSPVRTSSPRHPSGKDPWNQWTTYTLTLLQLEQTTDSSGRRGTGPPTEPGFSQGFFSILSPMEFSFLAAVASGLLTFTFTFTFMHLADAFIQSDLHCIQVTVSTFDQLLLSLGIEPMILALLTPCSTSWATGKLSWGHFISSKIIDLIAQILFKLN